MLFVSVKRLTLRKTGKESIRNIQLTGETYGINIPIKIVNKLGLRKRQKVVVNHKRGRITITD